MCSGLTAFSALKRLVGRAERGPVLLVGMGGVGMMGLSIARALFPHRADRRRHRCRPSAPRRSRPAPAPPTIRPIPGARKALLAATGGVLAACDFVGSESSLQFATSALGRGGKVVVTGLLGGTLSTAIAIFPLKAIGIEGTQAGTLAQADRTVRARARRQACARSRSESARWHRRKPRSTICAPAAWSGAWC